MGIVNFILLVVFLTIIFNYFIQEWNKEYIQDRLDKLNPAKKKKVVSSKSVFIQIFEELIYPFADRAIDKKDTRPVQHMLIQAGFNGDEEAIFMFMVKKIYFMIGCFFIGLVFILIFPQMGLMLKLAIILLFTITGFRYPDISLKSKIKYRMGEIQYNLPDGLDLLTVCVEAGLGLDAALSRVANEIDRTCPILALEFTRVGKDILAGIPRQTAYRNLSLRNNVDDLQSFVALLIQTDKLGTSISQSLRTFSDTLRTKRRQRVETLAAQASVKMVLPLVLCVLPAMMVVLLGPAAMSTMQIFANSGM